MNEYGPEPDNPIYTARIASRLDPSRPSMACFGMVRKLGAPDQDLRDTQVHFQSLEKGEALCVSTYTGRMDNPRAPSGGHWISHMPFDALTAGDLAAEFREMTDQGLFVASAAALYDGEWKVDVSNRHTRDAGSGPGDSAEARG